MKDWQGIEVKLYKEGTDIEASVGEVVTSFRGESYILTGGRPPHKASSTGRIYVRPIDGGTESEYYPGGFGLEWRAVKEEK